MDELKTFENAELGAVRTLLIDGEPYFVGKDVAEILGYSNSRKALADHVDDEDKNDGVTSIVFYGSHNGITTRIFNGMLCVSASAVEYEPYGKYKIPVTVSGENGEETTANIYLDEPLRKIGDYADYVDYDRQLLVRNIQKLIFTGDEKWAMQEINTLTTRFRVDIQHSISQSSGLCSHVPFVRSGVSRDEVLCGINNNTFYFRINKEIASNVIEFKDYLSSQAAKGTPVTLYYPRVTPITDPLDLPEIPTFAGTNVIDVDTTVKPSQMYVKYR